MEELTMRISPASAITHLNGMKDRIERLEKNEYKRINERTRDLIMLEYDLKNLGHNLHVIKIYHRYPERHKELVEWAENILYPMISEKVKEMGL